MRRSDCHLHLDRIGPPHRTAAPTIEDLRTYVVRESVELIFGIYEREATLDAFRDAGIVEIVPFYWERRPRESSIPRKAGGVKLHPYIEKYELNGRNVGNALRAAAERALPVLVHTDDRQPELSRGRLVRELAREFREVTFIMAHAGAYAPGVVGRPGESWTSPEVVRELVSEAIGVAGECENVFLEVSILASRTKAELIATKAPLNKTLLGSDFPIYKGEYGRVKFQEQALVEAGLTMAAIEGLHANAFRLFGSHRASTGQEGNA